MAKQRTQKETVAILQKTYPKFNKVAASMAAHPEKYGLCYTKEAKKALGEENPKKKPNRRKSRQMTVRVEPSLYGIIELICKEQGVTIQQMLEQSLQWYCNAAMMVMDITSGNISIKAEALDDE